MNLKNIILSLILLAALGFSTVLLIKNKPHANHMSQSQISDKPDVIVFNSRLTTYTKQGLIKSTLNAVQSTHFPKGNTTSLQQPNMLIYTETRLPWTIEAEHGLLQDGTQVVTLWGNVKLHQLKQPNNSETTITTDKLTYYPNRSFAETEQDVTIQKPDAMLQSHGMTVDLKKGILVAKSRTKGVFNEISQ